MTRFIWVSSKRGGKQTKFILNRIESSRQDGSDNTLVKMDLCQVFSIKSFQRWFK